MTPIHHGERASRPRHVFALSEPRWSLRVFSGYSLGGFWVPTGCLPDGLRVVSGYSEGGLKTIHHSSLNPLHSPRHPGSISIRNSENGGLRIRAHWQQYGTTMDLPWYHRTVRHTLECTPPTTPTRALLPEEYQRS
jgi:hypothetical protein